MRKTIIIAAVAASLAGVLGLAVTAAWAVTPRPPGVMARPAPPAFSHQMGTDYFGYFLPNSGPRIGPYRLDSLSLGGSKEFRDWEQGRRMSTYAPVMLTFSDLRSELRTNEQGQEYRAITIRVLPTSYRVAPGYIEFRGRDRRLGAVIFSGMLDARALQNARRTNTGGTVIRGSLQFGGQRFRNVSLNYFAGD